MVSMLDTFISSIAHKVAFLFLRDFKYHLLFGQGLLENGQDTDRQNFYFLYLTENENLSLILFEDL